jgi:general secretion pathway protein L
LPLLTVRLRPLAPLPLRPTVYAESAGFIESERDKAGRPLVVLAAATRILPDDTYLTEIELRQRKVTLSARSAGAARLIGALASDPEFRNPGFSAVTSVKLVEIRGSS